MPGIGVGWKDWLKDSLRDWEERGLTRSLHPLEPISPVRVEAKARERILFSGNDYLGLSGHPNVREAAARAAADYGMGPRGSALVCGYTTNHEELEHRLARLKKTDSTLLFPTGYAANLAILSTLASPETAIFSDELNHASLVDGCRLAKRSGAEVVIYSHGNVEELERLLEASKAPRKLVVTDGVFSMDGDLAPLPQIVEIKNRHDAWLMVDDAHGSLVLGEGGAGIASALGVEGDIEIQMGTLSKAFGTFGGFVACSKDFRDGLLNRGRSFVFSTALPVPVVAASLASLDVVENDTAIRRTLFDRIDFVARRLGKELASPIVPILVGPNERALEISAQLLERGFHVPGIRPPTVPEGTARLRIALSAAHGEEDVEGLLEALFEIAPDVLNREG